MTKLRTPLLSLGAHGSIADTLTFARRRKVNLVESKPIPINTKTLPQYYQRWLYQDYCAYWNTLSAATKQLWETNARPYHMTGFAYWMRTQLSTLPDITASYHLDTIQGSTVKDFSKNNNPGTVYGAIITPGEISNALSFDGIDDRTLAPIIPAIALTGDITIAMFIYPRSPAAYCRLLSLGVGSSVNGFFCQIDDLGSFFFYTNQAGTLQATSSVTISATNYAWQHLAITRAGTSAKIFKDGIQLAYRDTGIHLNPATPTGYLHIGEHGGGYGNVIIDNLLILNRALSQPEIALHAERRYPL